MSKKKKGKKNADRNAETTTSTLASHYIQGDYARTQKQEIESLPVDDPDSIHFDERKYDKKEYIRQSMDWIDYDTSNQLQEKYSTNLSKEFKQYSIQHSIDEYNYKTDSEYNNDDDEISDLHPSSGGNPRKFIENELKKQQSNYEQWKELSGNDENYEPPLWNNALANNYESYNMWWNIGNKQKYEMPHQALHGGVDNFDDETDIPLNSYWHKSTVSPESWNIMKNRYRNNMRPGSEEWNKWAFRNDIERKTLKWWPETTKIWFLRNETELLNSHEFRCKMLEHSALDEYWRLGELRWNRKLWEPYIRVGAWVIAPVLGLTATWWYRRAIGYRTNKQFDSEYKRWKETCAVNQGDEHYMFSWRDSLQKRRPPPVVSPAMSVEELGSKKHRSMSYHAERLMRSTPGDPY